MGKWRGRKDLERAEEGENIFKVYCMKKLNKLTIVLTVVKDLEECVDKRLAKTEQRA